MQNKLFRENRKALQEQDSRICGYYALVYSLQKSRGILMQHIIVSLDNNKDVNGEKVYHMFSSYFGVK